MLSIFIYEDDERQLLAEKEVLNNQMIMNDFDVVWGVVSKSSADILAKLEQIPDITGLYILDVEVDNDMSGIELATEIRKRDTFAKIVFVTSHAEMAMMTFERKVEPLDYIDKGLGIEKVKEKLIDDFRIANERYLASKEEKGRLFSYKVGAHVYQTAISEVIFLETATNSHKIILHKQNESIELNVKMNDMEEDYPILFRSHKSYLVNFDWIKEIDLKKKTIIFKNDAVAYVSYRKLSELKRLLRDKKGIIKHK
ncbi:LytR/AlgR family response regulator transcription factor [Dellaglioa sp. BT-FLS60]